MVEEEKIGASRMHLAASSEVFEKMLTGGFREAKESEIPIQNASARVFRMMGDYCYTLSDDFTSFSDIDLVQLLKLSHRFQTTELFAAIHNYLLKD